MNVFFYHIQNLCSLQLNSKITDGDCVTVRAQSEVLFLAQCLLLDGCLYENKYIRKISTKKKYLFCPLHLNLKVTFPHFL